MVGVPSHQVTAAGLIPPCEPLSEKWRRWAAQIRPEDDRREDGFYTKRELLEMCAADLDRVNDQIGELIGEFRRIVNGMHLRNILEI
jgi:hypothetical protein